MYPLVVDLDGTLIHTDMLHESTLKILRDKPWHAFRIPSLLARGKAILKQDFAQRVGFSPDSLPYNGQLLEWLKKQKADGRKLVLCTASDQSIANRIAEYLEIFDEVMASDGLTNLAGKAKADALEKRYGKAGFDYAGNSTADLQVWQCARKAIVVNASEDLVRKASAHCKVEHILPARALNSTDLRRVLRIHQWLKNLLLVVPIFAAHQLGNVSHWQVLALAFLSFCLCASSVYIANDLLDLESDRIHPRKRNRPFASGRVPIWIGCLLSPLIFLVSLGLAALVGGQFLCWLVFYFLLTCAYSWVLKRLILVDCLTLAMLYTLRIIAGAAAVHNQLSFWLLAFSVFLFLSLAFVKRYAELEVQLLSGKQKVHGRGYYTSDAPLIQTLGIASGYAAILVLALYLNSETVLELYQSPEIVWGAVPVLLFWISWMWMQAHRGNMHDDPLVFAVKDKASLLTGVAFAGVLSVGAVGWPW